MSDFFIQPGEKKMETPSKKIIPIEYIPIKLSSLGKLHAPEILHVRNFNFEEALDLSLSDEENRLEITMACLNNMIYEGFDPQYLHEEELKEILFNIYANFWGNSLPNYSYIFEEKELEHIAANKELVDKIKKENFVPKVTIEVENVKTKLIKDKFKEPIVIKKDDREIHFRLSRIKDVIEAKNIIVKRYNKENQEYADVINKLRKKKEYEIDPDRLAAYKKIAAKELTDIAKIIEALTLVKVDKKTLQTTEEKIKYINKVPIGFWKKVSDITADLKFGLDEEVEVISPITGEKVLRRFQFRFLDFIEGLELQDDSDYAVSFGD